MRDLPKVGAVVFHSVIPILPNPRFQQNRREPLQFFSVWIDPESPGFQCRKPQHRLRTLFAAHDSPAYDFTLEFDLGYGYVKSDGLPACK